MYMENTPTPTPNKYYDVFKQGELISSIDTLKNSWVTYKANWGKYAILIIPIHAAIIVPMIIIAIFAFASVFLPALDNLRNVSAQSFNLASLGGLPISFLIAIIALPVIMLVVSFFQFALVHQVIRAEEEIDTRTILKLTWSKFASLFWVGFLYVVIVFIGYLFLIIPGIILAIYYSFSIFVVITEDKHGFDALKRSGEIVRGYGWALVRRLLVWCYLIVAIIIFSMIPIIGWFGQIFLPFIITPLALIYFFSVYLNFSDRKARGHESDNLPLKSKLITVFLAALPIILMIIVIALTAVARVEKRFDNFDPSGLIDTYREEYFSGDLNLD